MLQRPIQQGAGVGSGIPRILPDPKICRTEQIGSIKAFAKCFVNNPISCPYATGFGEGYFCTHPRWKAFLRPTPARLSG